MLILIDGENQFASQARLDALKKEYHGNFKIIAGDELSDSAPIFAATDTMTMFTDKDLIIVKRLQNNRKKISIEHDIIDKLTRMQNNPPDLVFWEDHSVTGGAGARSKKKAPAKTKPTAVSKLSLKKYIEANGKHENYPSLSPNALQDWTGTLMEQAGIKNGRPFAGQIILRTGSNQNIISSEIAKLSARLTAQKKEMMTGTDLEIITVYEQESMVWSLTDAILARNKSLALKLVEKLLKTPADYPLIFSVTLRQLRNLYLTKVYAADPARLQKSLKLTPYTYSKLTNAARRFDAQQAKNIINKLVNLDYAVKQGKIEVKLGLNLLIATL